VVSRALARFALTLFVAGLFGAGVRPRQSPALADEKTVFLAGKLSERDLLCCSVAASRHPGVLLLDSPELNRYTNAFLQSFGPHSVIRVNSANGDVNQALFPRAERVVICPPEPRRLLLQAACLAGILRVPLYVLHDPRKQEGELSRRLERWKTREVYAVGDVPEGFGGMRGLRVDRLAGESAVVTRYVDALLSEGPVETLVVANPADTRAGLGGMSTLAPWIAARRRAALVLTNDAGDNVREAVGEALRRPGLARANHLILAANLQAVPMVRRPNPVEGGKDAYIEMEPLTPSGNEPFSFATGRLFHEDRAVVALMLARRRLLEKQARPKALIVSNPGGSLPLLETISRATAAELESVGYRTTAVIGRRIRGPELRRLLPEQNVFLWEGHHNTLINRFGAHEWTEPLRPSLIFLQSCLALHEHKAQPFLEHGAVAIVGTSTRTYSAAGGALSLAYFDALLHDRQPLGGALRQAKNYLLAFTLLKAKRLGDKARLNGSSLRTAWAATLWGDPTQPMPFGKAPAGEATSVTHRLRGNTLTVSAGGTRYDLRSPGFQADVWANAHLAGLVRKPAPGQLPNLVPLVFAEVALPKGPAGMTPRLSTRLGDNRWVFCWDARRRVGYLLAMPRSAKSAELRFHIDWQ
jgi:hypothetical protein